MVAHVLASCMLLVIAHVQHMNEAKPTLRQSSLSGKAKAKVIHQFDCVLKDGIANAKATQWDSQC